MVSSRALAKGVHHRFTRQGIASAPWWQTCNVPQGQAPLFTSQAHCCRFASNNERGEKSCERLVGPSSTAEGDLVVGLICSAVWR